MYSYLLTHTHWWLIYKYLFWEKMMKNFCFLSEAEVGLFLVLFSLSMFGNLPVYNLSVYTLSVFQYNIMSLTVSGYIKAYKAGYRGKGFAFLQCFSEDKIKFLFPVSATLNFFPAIIKYQWQEVNKILTLLSMDSATEFGKKKEK